MPRDAPTDIDRVTSNLRSNPVAHLLEREANPNPRDNWEGGFDYEYTFDNGARFKLLGIANQDDNLRIRQRFQRFADNTEELNLILNSHSITEERIVRGSYTFDFLQNQSVEIGGERAQTTLNSALALGLLNAPGTPSAALAGLVPVNLGLANSQVEEIRYEPFAIHNWRINPKLTWNRRCCTKPLRSTRLATRRTQEASTLSSRRLIFAITSHPCFR